VTKPVPGFFLLDKPAGPTSHDAVDWARRVLGTRRVGHCGTLDPLASGLLLLGVGEALQWQEKLSVQNKTYRGRMRFGLATDTDDITGQTLREADPAAVTTEDVRAVFQKFVGKIDQRVPRYSAVKVNGRRLYDYARAGETVALPVKTVVVESFDLLSYAAPEADFRVRCSKGTYVRSLARDAGEALGVGATLTALVREAIGGFSLGHAFVLRAEDMAPSSAARPVEDLRKAFVPLAAVGQFLS